MIYWQALSKVLGHPENRGRFIQTLFRLVWWKVNALFLHFPVLYPLAPGVQILCNPSSSYAGLIIYTHRPEPEVSSLVEKLVSSGDVVIDIGANIGAVSLLAAAQTPKKVYAFEPDVRVFVDLQENISINNFSHLIEVFSLAVSDSVGVIEFSQSATTETSHIVSSNESGTTVKTTTIDAFMKEKRLSRVHVLKIDVEGAEKMVLRGSEQTLKQKKISCLLLELNANNLEFGSSHIDCLKFLMNHGYKCYEILDDVITPLKRSLPQDQTHNLIVVDGPVSLRKVRQAWTKYLIESQSRAAS